MIAVRKMPRVPRKQISIFGVLFIKENFQKKIELEPTPRNWSKFFRQEGALIEYLHGTIFQIEITLFDWDKI